MLCNEPFEWWQTGAPEGRHTIVSRLSNVEYWRQQCAFWFPQKTYDIADENASAANMTIATLSLIRRERLSRGVSFVRL